MTFDEIAHSLQERRFRPSKPMREIRPMDLQRDPKIIASRKYNGNFASALIHAGGIEFYTASCLALARLGSTPGWAEGAWKDALLQMPPGTILLGEVFIPNLGLEDLSGFQKWYTWHQNGRAGTDAPTPPAAAFRAFDILARENQPTAQLSYDRRLHLIPEPLRVELAPYHTLSQAEQAKVDSQQRGIEGFVFWETSAPSLCKLNGANKPRGAAWKVKPVFTETFVLLRLACPDPDALVMTLSNGRVEFQCGSGLTSAERREIVALHQQGKVVQLAVAHNGYDEQGRPELPRALSFQIR